jgi:hypothetical protein
MGKREAVRDLHDASPWFARDRGDGAFDLGGVADGGGARLDAERGGSGLDGSQKCARIRGGIGIVQHRDRATPGAISLSSSSQLLRG